MTDESANPVQEAWANIAGLAAELEPGTTHEGCVEDAARALALAVLDEFQLSDLPYSSFRAEIEALGR